MIIFNLCNIPLHVLDRFLVCNSALRDHTVVTDAVVGMIERYIIAISSHIHYPLKWRFCHADKNKFEKMIKYAYLLIDGSFARYTIHKGILI